MKKPILLYNPAKCLFKSTIQCGALYTNMVENRVIL